ncbi:hypothetical protein B4168_0758 [Anoxybacillus flavithermus]|nr:hypothetical protein B4168_0758 [Anoxybacillus flavithermus]OAO86767.1 hypothetical protein GT23_1785 [Parageobacillus thermoglucosidasius]
MKRLSKFALLKKKGGTAEESPFVLFWMKGVFYLARRRENQWNKMR